MKLTALLKWGTVTFVTLMVVGGLTATHDASAQDGAPDEAITTDVLACPESLSIVQVTTDPAQDASPALVQTADGKLLTVFTRGGTLWSRASADGGATWGAETQITGCCHYNHSLAPAADGTLWLAYDIEKVIEIPDPSGGINVVVEREIWYRTSTNGGDTWSEESRFATDSSDTNRDYNPVVFQAKDGKLLFVWQSDRAGNVDIWGKIKVNDTWSADIRLTTNGAYDYAPTIIQAADGRLLLVWNREDALWQRSSIDGVTWSVERQIVTRGYNPSLAATGGNLWLAYELDGDVWYRTSTNQGLNWSYATPFTRFVAGDGGPALAVLTDGRLGLVWHSIRSGNWDIWFGTPGERDDCDPPPYIEWIEHRPQCNLESDDTITFSAFAQDETGVANVSLTWTLDAVAQADLPMFDDGTHGDAVAGDGVWTIQHTPLPEGSLVTYSACATDTDGNSYCYLGQGSFEVLARFVKTADILFVPDHGGYDTAGFHPYYTNALDRLRHVYDTWDTDHRCQLDGTILNQYAEGVVIWAVPDWGYITDDNDQRMAVQRYLAEGGKLFITGQNTAQYLTWRGGTAFLNNYLHATFRQENTGLYALGGASGDPISNGLALNISGGDGANNQGSKDEIDPTAQAEIVFTYQAGAKAMLTDPVWPAEMMSASPQDVNRQPVLSATPSTPATAEPTAVPATLVPPTAVPPTPAPPPPTALPPTPAPTATPADCVGSCTAGLRVDTGVYKVVYFAFGFEAINSTADRATVMGRVLSWLTNKVLLLEPAAGQAVPSGDVTFRWTTVNANRYEIQIDTVCTFDSPDLIDKIVEDTSYTHNFVALGPRCWRVRAQIDGAWGDWTATWSFSVADAVVQVTTDPADDATPTLVQTADGRLLIVFVRNGALWSRTSTDGDATWGAEARITDGCCRYNPGLARAANGTLWLAYDRDGDIWYRTSADGGTSWAAERQLTTHGAGDYDPIVFQAADGKLLVVWRSDRTDYSSIWYKTSADGGITWSADMKLSTNYENYAPSATVAPDGRLVVVWQRYDGLRQRSSSDGGATWSEERRITDWDRARPSLAMVGGVLWLVYERDGDIWYRTCADHGATWSEEKRFTRFVGSDSAPTVAALATDRAGIAWQSDRNGSPDIWFGSPGERDDINPPPYVSNIEHQPRPNPDSDDIIAFRAWAQDETRVASVHLVWVLNGVAQPDLQMYDDGVHGDGAARDGTWGIQYGPLPEGSRVAYRAIATDADGNRYRYPGQSSFTVLPRFVKAANILFVADAGGNNTPSDTAWFRPYYTQALTALGYHYDIWDTGLRGEPSSTLLNQYTNRAVIWAVPYWGYATDSGSQSIRALRAYLDAGGKLFITGQNIAQAHRYWGYDGGDFLANYLYATFRQEDTGLYAVVCNGRVLNISGGDGANNQYSKDEVDPRAPAEAICTYQAGVSTMLAAPIRPPEAEPTTPQDTTRGPASAPRDAPAQTEAALAPAGNVGSGTAGLRIDTGTHKLVYFAFGFEAINNAADRTAVMGDVLDWLGVSPLFNVYLPLVFSQASTTDSFWADRYELEPGECTTLHWSVTNARAVYLNDVGVPGKGAQQVCPVDTTTYILHVEREGGTQEYRLTIIVGTPTFLLVNYDFEGDFTASGTVLDRSGHGHDAQVTGAVTSAPGISGSQGVAFNGGYLLAASNPAAGKTDITFSLWFKTSDPTQNYKLASGAWWNWGPGSGWIMATHVPEFWSDDGQGVVLPNQPNHDNNFSAGEWIHEAVTYDGSRIKEYTNGQLINDWGATGAPLGQGNPMVVGAWPPFTAYNFRGSMDEFRIYGRSLTQQEVQTLYQQGR